MNAWDKIMKKVTTRPIRQFAFFATCLLFITLPRIGQAKPGDLDKGFGKDGTAIMIRGVYTGADKKIHTIRNLPDGKIFGGGRTWNYGETANSSGKKYSQHKPILHRYLTNGEFDPSFGVNGEATFDFGEGSDNLSGFWLQKDGKILAAGNIGGITEIITLISDPSTIPEDQKGKVKTYDYNVIKEGTPVLVRFNSDGTIDTTFGNGGHVEFANFISPAIKDLGVSALAVQPDHKIVMAIAHGHNLKDGTAVPQSTLLLRLDPSGNLDTSFGSKGMAPISFGNYENFNIKLPARLESLFVLPDGKIVAAGSCFFDDHAIQQTLGMKAQEGQYLPVMARLLSNGVLDPDFGPSGNGKIIFNTMNIKNDGFLDVVLTDDGKWIVTSKVWKDDKDKIDGYDELVVLARLNQDGSLDTSFGTEQNGQVPVKVQVGYTTLAIHSNGKIVLNAVYDLFQFNANGTPDIGFGDNGKVLLWDEVKGQGYGLNNYLFQAGSLILQKDSKIVVRASVNSIDPVNGSCLEISVKKDASGNDVKDEWGKLVCDKISDDEVMKRFISVDCQDGITEWHRDKDGDGFGSPAESDKWTGECTPPSEAGYIANSDDCNDDNASIHPGNFEVCGDLLDNNCNGAQDEHPTWYQDKDGDGYGDPNVVGPDTCPQPSGYVGNNKDCDDNDPVYLKTFYKDADGDGVVLPTDTIEGCSPPAGYILSPKKYPYSDSIVPDCNDQAANINPYVQEVCDGIDNDCSGTADDAIYFYQDSDQDGYGNPDKPEKGCSPPSGYVSNKDDCNDATNTAYLGAAELCDGLDNDCDKAIDEDFPDEVKKTFYWDSDSDGYGSDKNPDGTYKAWRVQTACAVPMGHVPNNDDCNDGTFMINPGVLETCLNNVDDNCNGTIDETSPETCDGLDNDCNGKIDDNVSNATKYFKDADNDGYGNENLEPVPSCQPKFGYVTIGKDCDDTDHFTHPFANENCDEKDNDCDGKVDENFANLGEKCDGPDADQCKMGVVVCIKGQPATICGTESEENIAEVCDGQDNNCDGAVDEGLTTTFYADSDKDGYGDPNNPTQACTQPVDYVTNQQDCNDAAAAIQPTSTEQCNGQDDNCNQEVDEGNPGSGEACETGVPGLCAVGKTACQNGSIQCQQAVSPVAEECDGKDNNCDGAVDEGPFPQKSCNTGKPGICSEGEEVCQEASLTCKQLKEPSLEACDGLDNNCDGEVDNNVASATTYFKDFDGDGWGNTAESLKSCSPLTGYVTKKGDCGDNDDTIFPFAKELCDGKDNDCDNQIDENAGCGAGKPGGGRSGSGSGSSPRDQKKQPSKDKFQQPSGEQFNKKFNQQALPKYQKKIPGR